MFVTIQRIIYKKPVVAYFSDFDCLNEVAPHNRKQSWKNKRPQA